MIIFSVLFALLINEWRNNVNENRRTETILENIHLEIVANQKLVQDLVPYHEAIRDSIGMVYNRGELEQTFFPDVAFGIHKVASKGVIQGSFQSIAWEVAKQEKISSRIDFSKSQALFKVYEQQETVNETVDRIINILSERESQRMSLIEETAIILVLEFRELASQEKNLLDKYELALQEMKSP